MSWKIIVFTVILSVLSPGYELAFAQDDSAQENTTLAESLGKQAEEIRLGILNGAPQFSMVGELRKEGAGRWSVNGESFVVDKDTEVVGSLKAGQAAEVRGYLKYGKVKRARQVLMQQRIEHSGNLKDETPRDIRANSSGLK